MKIKEDGQPDFEWAFKLDTDKPFVLHSETGVLGKVKKFWTGAEGDRMNDVTKFPVIELEEGHVLVAAEEHFTVLTKDETEFYNVALAVIGHTIKETIQLAASSGGKVGFQNAVVILEATMLAQLRALRVQKQ